jgi:hypothetical protein
MHVRKGNADSVYPWYQDAEVLNREVEQYLTRYSH